MVALLLYVLRTGAVLNSGLANLLVYANMMSAELHRAILGTVDPRKWSRATKVDDGNQGQPQEIQAFQGRNAKPKIAWN